MNNLITIGSCFSYMIANRYIQLKNDNFCSSTRHNRIDKIVDVYLNKNKPELEYSYLAKFKYSGKSNLDLRQQIDNQFSSRDLGKTSLDSDIALSLTDSLKQRIDIVIYDTFCDLLFKLLWSKDNKSSFFFNIKYSENWKDFFELEKERIAIDKIIDYYVKFVLFFQSINSNCKIIFVNFPQHHHPSSIVKARLEDLNRAFITNKFLHENVFFIPARPIKTEFINLEDRNHFITTNNYCIYEEYAKIIKAIVDNYLAQKQLQEINTNHNITFSEMINKLMNKTKMKEEEIMKLQENKKENIDFSSYFQQANKLIQQNKLCEAIDIYKYAVESCNDVSELIKLYKDVDASLFKHNKLEELIDIYKQAIQRYPNNHWFIKRLGDIYYKQQKIDNAISCYEQAIKIDRSFAWSYKKLGDAYYTKGHNSFQKSHENYQKAVDINSKLKNAVAKKVNEVNLIANNSNNDLGNIFKPADRDNYWSKRKDGLLYQTVKLLASAYVPDGKSILEVGCHTSSFIFELDWFEEKKVCDLPFLADYWKDVQGVEFIAGDFYKLEFDRTFDLVLCTQVVEHLEDPKPFIQKLLSLGKTVILSTTYEVPEGLCKYHIQDPISLEKFEGWFETEFAATVIIDKPDQRIWKNIIGVVKKDL